MTPREWLDDLLRQAQQAPDNRPVADVDVRERIDFVCRCTNRAGVRLLLSCLLAKWHRPALDIRKPYTEIGSADAFSGRTYDEQHVGSFLTDHRLPCNSTTAFLTPALRNIDRPLTIDVEIVGRPRRLYKDALYLLDAVQAGRADPTAVAIDIVRVLLADRDATLNRRAALLDALSRSGEALPLSSEETVTLIGQHLACKRSSRLPVLVIAAAYRSAGQLLGEQARPLHAHNAADEQTGSLGDVEIVLENDDRVRTVYEMKQKRVQVADIDRALGKIASALGRVDNYIIVTTSPVTEVVRSRAAKVYDETGGTELVVLDCLGFVRHFLHLFHRLRTEFLNAYQDLLLQEPDSAVGPALKEAFLALRQAAEVDD